MTRLKRTLVIFAAAALCLFAGTAFSFADSEEPDIVNPNFVTFDPNGGTGEMETIAVEEGNLFTAPECTFTPPEGMVFAGWDKMAAGDAIPLMEDMVLAAQWEYPPDPDIPDTGDEGELMMWLSIAAASAAGILIAAEKNHKKTE